MALRPAVIWRSVGGLPGPSEVRLESVWQSSCPSEDILPARPPASLAQFRGARGCQTARAHWAALAACPRGGFAEAPAAQRSSVVVRKSSRRALRPSGPGAHFSRVQIAGADAASARIAARAGPGALRHRRVFPGWRTRPGIAPVTPAEIDRFRHSRRDGSRFRRPSRTACALAGSSARGPGGGATKRAPATLPLRAEGSRTGRPEGSPAPGDQSTTTGGAATLSPWGGLLWRPRAGGPESLRPRAGTLAESSARGGLGIAMPASPKRPSRQASESPSAETRPRRRRRLLGALAESSARGGQARGAPRRLGRSVR